MCSALWADCSSTLWAGLYKDESFVCRRRARPLVLHLHWLAANRQATHRARPMRLYVLKATHKVVVLLLLSLSACRRDGVDSADSLASVGKVLACSARSLAAASG
eukprot:1716102-Alexandrium_andersonii.AAC.1